MRGIKIPQQDFALQMQEGGGGGGVYLRDTMVIINLLHFMKLAALQIPFLKMVH